MPISKAIGIDTVICRRYTHESNQFKEDVWPQSEWALQILSGIKWKVEGSSVFLNIIQLFRNGPDVVYYGNCVKALFRAVGCVCVYVYVEITVEQLVQLPDVKYSQRYNWQKYVHVYENVYCYTQWQANHFTFVRKYQFVLGEIVQHLPSVTHLMSSELQLFAAEQSA